MEERKINVGLRSGQVISPYSRERRSAVSPDTEAVPTEDRSGIKDSKLLVKGLEKVIDVSLFMIFFGFPIFFTGLTLQGIVFEKQIFFYFWMLLALISWTAKAAIIGEMNIRRTPLDIPIIAFWLFYLVATIFSIDRWHSFWGAYADPSRGFMNITALVIAYYLIVSNFTEKRMRLIMTGLISSGAIITIWTILTILNVKFLPDRLAQLTPQVSLSGSILGLAIIICSLLPLVTTALLKISENENMRRITKRFLTISLVVILLLNLLLIMALFNFVPWPALYIGTGLFLVFIISQIVRPKGGWSFLPVLLFVLVMVIGWIGAVPVSKMNFAEVKPLDFATSTSIAKESLRHDAFLGSGPATFGYDFSMYRPKEFNNNMFYNLRFLQGTGVIFESLSTIGGIGTILLALLLLSFLSVEFYLITREKEKNKLVSLGLFSSALILLISGVMTKADGTVVVLAALLSIVSLAQVLKESGSEEKTISLSLKASPKYALALAFVFMVVSAGVAFLFVFLGKAYAADILSASAEKSIATDRENSVAKMTRAIQLNDKESKYYTQLGQYYMVLANNEALKPDQERDVQKIQQYLNFSIAVTKQAKEMAKTDISATEILGQIYENAGLYVADSLPLAMDTYQQGLALEPHNPNYYLKLGQIDLALAGMKKDDSEKKQLISSAKDMFAKSTEEKNDFADGYFQLSIAEGSLGNTDAAIEDNKKAVSFNSSNDGYIINLAKLLENRGSGNDKSDAEQLYKAVTARNDKNIDAHFYLGLLYEKEKKKQEAKDEFKKVISLLPSDNDETRKQLERMISNIDAGIENTPQNLGLAQPQDQNQQNNQNQGQ